MIEAIFLQKILLKEKKRQNKKPIVIKPKHFLFSSEYKKK
jgi:hypothetical protein